MKRKRGAAASPEAMVECHRLQGVLDTRSQAHPLMTVS